MDGDTRPLERKWMRGQIKAWNGREMAGWIVIVTAPSGFIDCGLSTKQSAAAAAGALLL